MRKRLVGAATVGLIALGIWLAGILRGPGLGGNGSGAEQVSIGNTTVSQANDVDLVGDGVDKASSNIEPPVGEFLTIVIHGDRYRLASRGDTSTGPDIELKEIVKRAKGLPENEQHVRVRLYLTKTAQEGARSDLYAALQNAGILPEEIQEVSIFVD